MNFTEQQYNDSVTTLSTAIKEAQPQADVRLGTPVRDLVLNPGGVANATAVASADAIRSSADLAAGTDLDEELVDGLLRNLGVDRRDQTNAIGSVRIILDTAVSFAIPVDYELTYEDITYRTTTELTVGKDESIIADLYLTPYTDTNLSAEPLYSVVVPVSAINGGNLGNIPQGTTLEVTHGLTPYTQWQIAAVDFTGGSAGETVDESLARAERQISQQSMSSAPAIEGLLQTLNPQVTSSGTVRSTDQEIQRNKRNVFGMVVGSHVDIYSRDFPQATITSIETTAQRVTDGTYKVTGLAAPGWMTLSYASMVEPFPEGTSNTVANITRYAINTEGHLADVSKPEDIYGTKYQYVDIELTGVSPVQVDGNFVYPETLTMYVGAYYSPSIELLQSSVDSAEYKSNTTDHLVRAPYLALTSINLQGRNDSSTSTLDELKLAVLDVINSVPIGETLTSSSISSKLKELGITVTSNVNLSAEVTDAYDNFYTLAGSELNPDLLNIKSLGISRNTTTFTSTASRIQLDITETGF